MVSPHLPSWSVVHIIHLVGTDGDVDVWALSCQDVLGSTPFGSVPTIFRPYKMVVWLFDPLAASVLVPSVVPSEHVGVLGWSVSVRVDDGLVKWNLHEQGAYRKREVKPNETENI